MVKSLGTRVWIEELAYGQTRILILFTTHMVLQLRSHPLGYASSYSLSQLCTSPYSLSKLRCGCRSQSFATTTNHLHRKGKRSIRSLKRTVYLDIQASSLSKWMCQNKAKKHGIQKVQNQKKKKGQAWVCVYLTKAKQSDWECSCTWFMSLTASSLNIQTQI